MATAWIGFAGGVIAVLVSAIVALRQSQLDMKVRRQAALFERDLRVEEIVTRYREPLAAAAFDLQSRLYNVLRLDFLGKYGGGERAATAHETTFFRIAQYFGWTELLRRDILFLSFPEDEDSRRVARLQREIASCFLTDGYGHALMIWSDEQRAIGERMIVEEHGKVICMGYAAFHDCYGETFAEWSERLRSEIGDEAATARLRDAQHLLCELVEALDPHKIRYTQPMERA
jgi:hypothetical protein